ncbi:hypothetical protein ACV36C_38375, partial [Pseudomonas aeruginosa]
HNQNATLSSAAELSLSRQEAVDNHGGKLVTDSSLRQPSASQDHSRSGTTSANAAADIHTGVLNNSQKGNLESKDGLGMIATE